MGLNLIVFNVVDVDMPHGAYKRVTNGTYIFKRQEWIEYPDPRDVPALMTRWLLAYNQARPPVSKQVESARQLQDARNSRRRGMSM